MAICHEKKIIFVHIPKCAGSSIEYFFKKNNLRLDFVEEKIDFKSNETNFSEVVKLHKGKTQHLSASDIDKLLGNIKFKEYYKFSIVRNPYDRLVSYYFYIKKQKKPQLDKIHVDLVHSSSSFNEFIMKAIDIPAMYPIFNQYVYLSENYNNINKMIDYIGKFETLNRDFKTILRKSNFATSKLDKIKSSLGYSKYQLPRINTSNRGKYQNYYNSELRQIVTQICRKDCELFGYEF